MRLKVYNKTLAEKGRICLLLAKNKGYDLVVFQDKAGKFIIPDEKEAKVRPKHSPGFHSRPMTVNQEEDPFKFTYGPPNNPPRG